VQSLIHAGEVDDLVKDYGMVIVDECHHVPYVNFEKVLGAVNARYVYGLTATPARQDGQHPITFMQCGPIRYNVDAKSQAVKRNFEHYVIPCFTGFKNRWRKMKPIGTLPAFMPPLPMTSIATDRSPATFSTR
jgi:superfamily II DNA or RNA helicase